MRFSGGINRPPYETADGYLQTTEGCSHNHCLFCTYFKDQKFRKSMIEEIEEDIKEIPEYSGAPKRIFLQGADGFAADYDVLMKTAELLHKYVPSVETIGGYARIDNFYDKTEEQLRNMASAGFADPYIGVESGDDVVLKKINKGYTAAQAREVLEKIDASGLPYVVNFLNGAGGHEYGLTNARLTAKLYEGLHMTMVNTSMLTVVPGTPLYRAMEKGLYAESTEMEKLEEIYELVKCLTNDTIFMNEHASNLFHVECRIPEQKEELLAYIRKFMEDSDEKKAGVDDLYIGVECGLNDVLENLNKGYSADETKKQCLRLNAAGIHHCDLLMLGTAGKGRGLECARASAALENEIKPDKILINTMSAFVGTQLDEDIKTGAFMPATEKENLEEEREFLSGLELPECYFWAVHPLDSIKIEGVLKDEKKQMLDRLSWSIDHVDESAINRTSRVGTL